MFPSVSFYLAQCDSMRLRKLRFANMQGCSRDLTENYLPQLSDHITMKKIKILLSLLVSTMFFLPSKAAEGKDQELTTSQIKWGKHVAGPEIAKAEDLKGKVVLLVLWGS